MDNELSNATHLTIALIIVSIIVGIIALLTILGQIYQRSVVSSVTDVIGAAYGSELTSLSDTIEPVPVASVYMLIDRNMDIIEQVKTQIMDSHGVKTEKVIASRDASGKLTGDIFDSLKEYFGKKFKVKVDETDKELFIITVDTTTGG